MYGETGTAMRQELAALLRQHRVQQRLGGPPEAREEAGLLIRRYRQNVLLWCSQAMRATSPVTFSNLAPAQPNPFRAVGGRGNGATPAGELARALELARQQSTALPATSEQVTTPTGHDVIERWRASARAASLAEHDTAHRGRPTHDGRPGPGRRRRRRSHHPGTRRPRPALPENTRLGATRPERTTRVGRTGSRARRQPRPAGLHRRRTRLATEDEDHRGPCEGRNPRSPSGRAQPHRRD